MIEVNFKVNGNPVKINCKPTAILTDVLREQLGLTSVKKGCETGDCGSCSVILDGKLVNSCIILAPTVDGCEIVTLEGLNESGEAKKIQEAMVNLHGFQCGFCAPGMILSAKVLLDQNPKPTREEIARGISGNLCRCTGYVNQIKAIQKAARISE